jgi:outer membrane lipoprotein-sorting protein
MSEPLTTPPLRRYRGRAVRWGLPAAVLAVALAVPAAGNVLTANATPKLPTRTPQQLLVDVQNARVDGLSGTVVQHSALGLPTLPDVTTADSGSSSLTSLISGTHTMRVWYSGPDRARLALLGTLGESDVIVNQRDLWVWSSTDRTARHRRLPAHAGEAAQRPEAPVTPQSAADRALAAVTPTTRVSTAANATVAGRSAYELVLAPRDSRSLVREVRIAVDGATRVPLRFQLFATGQRDPAFEVGFTQVSFQRPGAEHFRFVPPPGTKVSEATAPDRRDRAEKKAGTTAGAPRVVGTGWTSVVVARVPAGSTTQTGSAQLDRVLASLPSVSGAWGSGRLLRSAAFSALLTDDGRLIAGAVAPDLLYAAAAK